MSQRRLLRTVAVFGPGVIAGVFETLRHRYLDSWLPLAYGNAVTFVLVVLTSALVLDQLFRRMDHFEARLRAEQDHNLVLQERDRIAQELHDSLGQGLFFLDVTLDDATRNMECGMTCPATTHLLEAKEGVDELQKSLRQSIYRLRTTQPPQENFISSIRKYLQSIADQSDVQIEVERLEHICREDCPDLEIGIVRILQEAVFNALRHSEARHIRVSLYGDASGDTLIVEDDGKGFDPAEVPDETDGHFGFSMLRWEATRLGGTLDVQSTPGGGTTIRFERSRKGARN